MNITCLAIHSNDNYPGMPKWSYSLPFAYLQAYLTTSRYYTACKFTHLGYFENDDLDRIHTTVLDTKPDLLAISCYVWNMAQVLSILPLIKAVLPRLVTVLGGPEISSESDLLMTRNNAIDYMVAGEGELTFRELVEHLFDPSGTKALMQIHGLIYRESTGAIVVNPKRENLQNLDTIPSPYLLGLLDHAKLTHGLMALETQRGCVLDCSFCNYQKGFKNIRFFSLDRVLEEIRWMMALHPKQLYLMDPAFNSNRKRARTILSTIAQLRQGIPHKMFVNAEMIPDLLNEELILLSRDAGMTLIEMGIQSLAPEAMAPMNRYRNEEKLFANMHLALKHGLRIVPQLIFGLPGDSINRFFASFDRIYDIPSEDMDILHLLLLPGTRYRNQTAFHGIVYEEASPYRIIASNDFSAQEIQRLAAFSRLVLATMPLKPILNGLNWGMPYHQLFTSFMDQVGTKAFEYRWPIFGEHDRELADRVITGFADYLTLMRPKQTKQLATRCKMARILLAGHLMRKSKRT